MTTNNTVRCMSRGSTVTMSLYLSSSEIGKLAAGPTYKHDRVKRLVGGRDRHPTAVRVFRDVAPKFRSRERRDGASSVSG